MNIFSRFASAFSSPKEEKFNPAYSGTPYIYNTPQEKRMEKNYRNFAREGYQDNDTVYKCISYIARNGSAIQPILYQDQTMEKTIDSHPILDLLKKPNNEQSGVAYREALLSYKLLAGNAFQYVLRANPNQPPNELWPLRPDQTKIVLQSPRGVIGYKFDPLGTALIQPTEIGHTKYWHPISEDMFGMSPLESAAIFADQSIAAKKWNLALLQNMARPAGAWTVPTVLSPNDRNNLENKLNQKFSGSRNAGKAPVLDAGLTWTSIGLQPAQMDWLPGIQYNAAAIANIYNISPQLIGDTSSTTYENMQQAKVASYTEAIFPELDDLYALWNTWLLPMYKDLTNAYLYYDKESVEVIQEMIQAQKDAKADRGNKMWMSGQCTLNEARELAGLPPIPGGDVFRFAAILVQADELDAYAEQSITKPAPPPPTPILPDPTQTNPAPPTQEPPQKQPDQELNDTPTTSSPDDNAPDNTDSQPGKSLQRRSVKALDLNTAEEKQAYMKSVESSRAKWQKEAEQRLQSYFDDERKAVVAAINKAALPASAEDRAVAAITKSSSDLKTLIIALYTDIVNDVGNDVLKQLKSYARPYEMKAGSSLLEDNTQKYLTTMAGTKIVGISDGTREKVRNQLSEGVKNKETIPQLANRIDGLYLDQIIPNRSTVIARTETHAANAFAAWQAGKASGMTLDKVWLSMHDAKTRPAHVEADEQQVGIDEPFIVDGDELDYPGDSSGSAENVIQCRCSMYLKRSKVIDQSDDDEKGYRLPRQQYRQFMEVVLI
jgi:HK97 family phage portal protein